jgi:hypothetical protein
METLEINNKMKLIFESDLIIPPMSETFLAITDGARIRLEDIKHDKARGLVEILIQRKELIRFRKTLFGTMQPVYGEKIIETLVVIEAVEDINIKYDHRLVSECNSYFTILFGLKISNNEVYFSSAEEFQGTALCQVFIKTKETKIKCIDMEER